MPITKADIEARLETLRAKAELLRQQHSLVAGAISDCEFWLSKVEEPVPQENE